MYSSVKEHDDAHLAPLCSRMSGGAAAPRERFAALLRTLGFAPSSPVATALDLGAGSGFQSLPLAAAGLSLVHATAYNGLVTLAARRGP